MKQYPILIEGEKLVLEDLGAAYELAGTIDDAVRRDLMLVPAQGGSSVSYAIPLGEGPLVVNNGIGGHVLVNSFTGYNASSESPPTLITATSGNGSSIAVGVPPVASNHRWDLLYAIVSDVDGTPDARRVEAPDGTFSTESVNTAHASQITFAWASGTDAPQSTNPYPSGSLPTIPTPATGQAIIPLAYVHLFDTDTGSTQYNQDRIINATPRAPAHPEHGLASSSIPVLLDDVGAAHVLSDPTALIQTATAHGGWPLTNSGKRPPAEVQHVHGQSRVWILARFDASFPALSGFTVIAQISGGAGGAYIPKIFTNRIFEARFYPGGAGMRWAQDETVAGQYACMPGRINLASRNYDLYGVPNAGPQMSCGQSIRETKGFNVVSGAPSGHRIVAVFDNVSSAGNSTVVPGAGGANDPIGNTLIVSVDSATGKLWLIGRTGTNNMLANACHTIVLDYSEPVYPYNFASP